MRVQYTLPGFLPAETLPPDSTSTASPFSRRLNYLPVPRWLNWQTLLRLDQVPVNATSLDPPPRPTAVVESRDAASERLLWRQMLDRQVAGYENVSPDSARSEDVWAIERMLALLMRFRQLEDFMAARHLSEPEN
jgi:hypothetical protein